MNYDLINGEYTKDRELLPNIVLDSSGFIEFEFGKY